MATTWTVEQLSNGAWSAAAGPFTSEWDASAWAEERREGAARLRIVNDDPADQDVAWYISDVVIAGLERGPRATGAG